MLIGGSAGSTAGGMKVIRILVMFKLIKREIIKIFHPRAILPIKTNGKMMSNETVAGIYSFIALYLVIFVVGPTRNFGGYHQATKLLFSFLMLLGRLELFTIIALIAPKDWRREI